MVVGWLFCCSYYRETEISGTQHRAGARDQNDGQRDVPTNGMMTVLVLWNRNDDDDDVRPVP